MALFQRINHAGAAAPSSLTANMSPSDLTFTISNISGWPTGAGGRPFVVVVDPGQAAEEKILCNTQASGTVTVVSGTGRGFDGTLPVAHNNGAAVEHVVSALELDDDNDHVYTTSRDDHTQYALLTGSRPFTGPVTLQDGLTDTGPFVQNGPSTLNGNATVSGTLGVTGATSLSSLAVSANAAVTGNLTAATVDAGLTGATSPGRFVGSTVTAPPTTGTFAVGDFVVDQTGVVWTCITAGSPGIWSVPVGGQVGHATGPAATFQVLGGSTTNVVNLTCSLVGGNIYLVSASAYATVITSPPSGWVTFKITDSGTLVPNSEVYMGTYAAGTYIVGSILCGTATLVVAPGANVSDTFSITTTVGGTTGQGVEFVAANQCTLVVTRIA
jgi:hypothetical protein